jgi:hypothetical protein
MQVKCKETFKIFFRFPTKKSNPLRFHSTNCQETCAFLEKKHTHKLPSKIATLQSTEGQFGTITLHNKPVYGGAERVFWLGVGVQGYY